MFCRHVFGNISGRFCGISLFWGNFAGFRGNTWISRVRDRAKYQKPWVVNGGCQSSNLCHAMDHSRGALVALGRPHRIDWGNNEQMHVKLPMEPNPKTEELRPKGLQLNERFWRGARVLHSRNGVGYMHLVFSRTVSSSTRNNEMITKGKMLLLFIKFSQLILFFLLIIFIHCQEIKLWEFIKWSPKRKCFDLL